VAVPDSAAAPHAQHQHTEPNVVVAHLREGLEVVHLYTGRPVCQLHLPHDALHADIDGDGVVDHVALHAGDGHGHAGRCTAVGTSGIPPRGELFRALVCGAHRLKRFSALLSGDGGGADGDGEALHAAAPIMLPVARSDGTYSGKRGQHGILLFMTADGEVAALNGRGSTLWRRNFGTGWGGGGGGHLGRARAAAAADGGDDGDASPQAARPTFAPLALWRHAVPTAVLAAGDAAVSIISEHGQELTGFELGFAPTSPIQAVDFSGDGATDLIVSTAAGVFGYEQVQHFGGFQLSAIMLTLFIALLVVFFTQQFEAGGARERKLRSTEYTE
jgi:hypothetical protein